MIPTFRTIVLCGRALSIGEQGPVRYSGFELVHPDCARARKHRTGSLAFWVWIPVERRQSWRGTSLVSNVQDHERARLALGELVEVRRNWRAPIDIPNDALARWLWPHYLRQCEAQAGFIPDQVMRAAARCLSNTPGQDAEEHAERRIIL